MTDGHIVIVSYNWPPRNAIGTHRPYSWARDWSARGHRVTVLTASKYQFDEPLDLFLSPLPAVEVLEVPYLRLAGRAAGLWAGGQLRQWVKKSRNSLSSILGQPLDIRQGWWRAAKEAARDLASAADVVVSTYGPESSHLLGCEMKKTNPSVFWIADYRDLWSQNTHLTLGPRQHQLTRRRELETVGRYADALTTVSDELAEHLRLLTGLDAMTIENGFDLSEEKVLQNITSRPDRVGKPIRIVYTGMIYSGLRDPGPLFEALYRLRQRGLIRDGEVICEFYGTQVEPVSAYKKDPRYDRWICIGGHVPRQEALAEQQRADLLLLLESPEPRAKGVVTGKLFEYIASGTPVLSIGSEPNSAIGRILYRTGTGVCLGQDVEGIGKVILELCESRSNSWYSPVRSEIMQFSRSVIADRMYNRIIAPHLSLRSDTSLRMSAYKRSKLREL